MLSFVRPVMKRQVPTVSVTMRMLIITIILCCSVKFSMHTTHRWNHILVVTHTHTRENIIVNMIINRNLDLGMIQFRSASVGLWSEKNTHTNILTQIKSLQKAYAV